MMAIHALNGVLSFPELHRPSFGSVHLKYGIGFCNKMLHEFLNLEEEFYCR